MDLLLRHRIEATTQQATGHDLQQQQRTYSPAPLEPSNTTKTINTNKINCSLNGSEGGTICSTNNSILNGTVGGGGGGGTLDDVNESFGMYCVCGFY